MSHIPGYEVTPDGRVLSIVSNWRGYGVRELKKDPNRDGYPRVRVFINGKRCSIPVHRLVAEHFLPPRPSPRHEIRHLNGDKWDAAHTNLAWGTQKENADDRERHGRTSRGDKHSEAIKRGLAKAEGR